MTDEEFVNRIAYVSTCIEKVLNVEPLTLWTFVQYGQGPTFDIPNMPVSFFASELRLPIDQLLPFKVTLAYYSRTCINEFFDMVQYRLGHPYKLLAEFDLALYQESYDLLDDILYEWCHDSRHRAQEKLLKMYDKIETKSADKEKAIECLNIYNVIKKIEIGPYFTNFCVKKMKERLREFWIGFSLSFKTGIYGTTSLHLIFVTERGDEVYTEPLFEIDYNVFSSGIMFERNVRRLFQGIFQPVKYPAGSVNKGFDIFTSEAKRH